MQNDTKKILKKVFPNTSISINSNINNTLEWDSISHIILISELERYFKKKLSTKEVIRLSSIKRIDKEILDFKKKK